MPDDAYDFCDLLALFGRRCALKRTPLPECR